MLWAERDVRSEHRKRSWGLRGRLYHRSGWAQRPPTHAGRSTSLGPPLGPLPPAPATRSRTVSVALKSREQRMRECPGRRLIPEQELQS